MKDFVIPSSDDRDLGTPPSHAEATVSLTIDGFEVTVPEGTSVMRAAALAGIPVPKLCATDNMEAFGSCRLCVVEIEGRRGLPASCTTPVAAGMVVQHPVGEGAPPAQGGDGALPLRLPARLPDLLGQRRQRAAGDGRRRRPARDALRAGRRTTSRRAGTARRTRASSPRTTATPISPSTRPNASSARAACAPATRCRAPSR